MSQQPEEDADGDATGADTAKFEVATPEYDRFDNSGTPEEYLDLSGEQDRQSEDEG